MSKIIIGIHGLANKPPTDPHAKDWVAAIREGLRVNHKVDATDAQIPFELVYWANYLYKGPLHNDKNFSFDKNFDTEPYYVAAPGALKRYNDNWMDRVRAEVGSTVGWAVDEVKAHVGLDWVGDFLLQRIVRDLAFYYDSTRLIPDAAGQPRAASAVLKDELRKVLLQHKADTILLIAHSMGTIISYDVLRELGKTTAGVAISDFITVGSPLGLPKVKEKLDARHPHDVRTPTIVKNKWKNYADRKDPVSLDSHLRDDFKENASKVRVEDDLILNDYVSPFNKEPNHHKIFGYLRAPEVSDHIKAFLSL